MKKPKFDNALYHLPPDYGPNMTVDGRRQARLSVLHSWYDVKQPNVLCTNVENYLAAHRLFVDYHLKRDPAISPKYFWPDPVHKYQMLRAIMQPPVKASEPTKTAMTAARGTAKTVTCVVELACLCALARPNTGIVVSELNKERTMEEIGAIKQLIEEGQYIRADFGPAIAPQSRFHGDRWSEGYLGFRRYNHSFIAGVSALSKHRGRHPPLGILDDPDDGELSKKPEWRRKFFNWLFRTWLPMFRRGAKCPWIQTVTHGDCLISYAMHRQKDMDHPTEEDEREHDHRFDDWHRINFDLLYEDDATGETRSIWPEYRSVESYENLVKAHGRSAALAEYRGQVVAEGALVFRRDAYRHGYMHCREGGGAEYMLDLKTGVQRPWPEFLASLYRVGGGDIADSLDPHADRSGLVIIGVDPDGIIYVLDCYNRRCHADKLVDVAFGELAPTWQLEEFGWEVAAMQDVIKRYADRYAARLRNEGLAAPINRGITNQAVSKPRRIIGVLAPVMGNDEIRFLRFEPFTDAGGVTHVPVEQAREADYQRLGQEVDDYTDRGPAGHDDAIDGLHLALRVAWRMRGELIVKKVETVAVGLDAWHEAGVHFDRNTIPPEAYPAAWRHEAEADHLDPDGVGIKGHDSRDSDDPYDGYE